MCYKFDCAVQHETQRGGCDGGGGEKRKDGPYVLPALRNVALGFRAGAGGDGRDVARDEESAQSAASHVVRPQRRRFGGTVRAHDSPLRETAVRLGHDGCRRRRGRDRRGGCLEPSVLRPAAFQAAVYRSGAPTVEIADCRADVRPLRHAAARHGRGVPADPRRLRHGLERRAHGAARRRLLRSR